MKLEPDAKGWISDDTVEDDTLAQACLPLNFPLQKRQIDAYFCGFMQLIQYMSEILSNVGSLHM